jgi:aminoglycoside phosphotransferase (APT) family kinase protein
MGEPGPLLASGRDSDIFEYGEGLVLRRSREGHSMETEARTMEYVRQEGYPVPAVSEISDDGNDLVMERVDGPSMRDVLGAKPWTLRRQGALLADLHRQLHEIAAPDWIRDAPCGHGDRIIHLDLHPLNVLLSPKGPVVIDWPNAARGDPNSDVALTWALIAAGGIPAGRVRAALLGLGRSMLVKAFLAPFDIAAVRQQLPAAVDWKVADAHLSAAERRAMTLLADSGSAGSHFRRR